MSTRRTFPLVAAALLAAGAAAGMAHAQDRGRNQDSRDIAALASMKVSLSQAVATAEQQTGGRAVGVDVSQRQGATWIAVEVATAQGVRTVLVDAQSGQVTATRDAGSDNEDND